jgi:hypothetical protein
MNEMLESSSISINSQLTLDVSIKDEREGRVVSFEGFSGLVRHHIKLLFRSLDTRGVSVSLNDLFISERAASVGDAEAGE